MYKKTYYVYLITNYTNTVIYCGVTNNLERRIFEHKNKLNPKSFSSKYNLNKLVYYEEYDYVYDAIDREKQIKAGPRRKKEDMINGFNPKWKDLSDGWDYLINHHC